MSQGIYSDVQRLIRILTTQEPSQAKGTLPVPFSKNCTKTEKGLKLSTTFCTDSFDNLGNLTCGQIVVPPENTEAAIKTMLCDPMQGHPGASKLLAEFRKRYYGTNLARNVQLSKTLHISEAKKPTP